MKKSIIGIIMAVTLVGSSLAFPIQAYASADIDQGTTRDTVVEDEEVGINNGTVGTNNGKITTNNGTVETNKGKVIHNSDGGIVTTNDGTVGFNYDGAKITTNNGTVASNKSGATVETNSGGVIVNDGTVTTNNGKVVSNKSGATVETNSNSGTVETNSGTVTTNSGTVDNNFGGTVNGGTVTNQWYEYILTGGSYVSGSCTTIADKRTWIGKAESTDNVLRDFYITVAANDGMTFDYATVGDEQVQGITNADGSISFGNISSAISIFFKQLININNNDDEDNANNTNESSVDIDTAGMVATIESIIANEEAMPVASFISDEAVAKIPEAAKNSGASYNLSVITSPQGFTAAVNKISEAVKVQNAVNNASGRIAYTTIYSEKPMLFTTDVLNAISASDIDFIFVFMHNGKMYKVTIPRGAKIDFTGHACEGPLYFGQILGTTEEIG